MRWRSTLFLLLANLLWLSIYYIASKNKNLSTEDHIMKFSVCEVSALDIAVGESGDTYSFRRDKNEWFVQKPFLWPANSCAIEALLHQLSNITAKSVFSTKLLTESGQSLENYGLKTPSAAVTLHCGDKLFNFSVGAKVHLSKNMYMLDNSTNEIFVVSQENFKNLFCNKNSWYNTFIFYSGLQNVSNISFKHKQQNVFIRKENGQWFIKNPINAKANNERTEMLISQIQGLELIRFLSEEEIKTFLHTLNDDQALYKIVLSDDNSSTTIKFANYSSDEQIYLAQLESYAMPFLVRTTIIDRLSETQETLRERKIFSIDYKNVQKISFFDNAQTTIMQKIEGDNWELHSYADAKLIDTTKASSSKIDRLINNLNNLTVEEFFEVPPFDNFYNADFSCKYKFEISTNTDNFEFNIFEYKNTLFLKLKDEAYPLKIALANKDMLIVGRDSFSDKTIWTISEKEVISKIEFASLRDFIHIKRDAKTINNGLKLASVTDLKLKQEAAIAWIASSIRDLKAKKFSSLNFLESTSIFGHFVDLSWPYKLKITTIDANNASREYFLKISSRISASWQLASANDKIFWLKQSWINALFFITDWPRWKAMSDIYN